MANSKRIRNSNTKWPKFVFLKIGIFVIGVYLVFGAWKLELVTTPNT